MDDGQWQHKAMAEFVGLLEEKGLSFETVTEVFVLSVVFSGEEFEQGILALGIDLSDWEAEMHSAFNTGKDGHGEDLVDLEEVMWRLECTRQLDVPSYPGMSPSLGCSL